MYIHEVIIDGFKSYAKRTVVSGFDPQFNAITGLNGTGKSNILDSICFVLGISNLSQVRAGSLQELVYKQGQAGVTKASVTIVFNNPDPNSSPIGYDTVKQITVTRQVVIGGKNKYMINGKTVQQSEIQNMFHSVQLNVNNPHFLIMQGRITKVLNMKPIEILSMLEEAAGTKMFQTKKESAMKTIEKKQLKVDELTKCMDDEINPQLEGLREQHQHFVIYQANSTELARLERFCIASEYCGHEKIINESQTGKKVIEDEKKVMETTIAEKKSESERCALIIDQISSLLQDELKEEFASLKKNEEDLSKEVVKVKTLLKNHTETLQTEKDTAVTLERQVNGAKETLIQKDIDLKDTEKELSSKEIEAAAAEKEAVSMRDRHQNALAGIADGSSAEVLSLPEQVATWEKRAREAQSQLQQGSQRAEHTKTKLKDLKGSVKSEQNSHSKVIKDADTLRAAISTAEGKLKGVSFSEKDEALLRSKSTDLHASTSALTDEVESITTQLEARLKFEFKDPERGFDRSKVKGCVARLINVINPVNATALEVVAGNKLYQIVVDTEVTGKLLVSKGELRSRITILPLNKMTTKLTDPAKIDRAKEVATAKGGSANFALELVGYDQEIRRAVENVFGNAIICDNPQLAKEICFDAKIKTRTVTIDGDVFDPSGTMTGGAKSNLGSLLSRISGLSLAKNALEIQTKELISTDAHLQRMESQGSVAREMERELDLKRHALLMCEQKLAESSFMLVTNEINALETQLVSLDQESVTLKATFAKANEELKQLKDAEKNVKKQRENAMRELETNMKKSQKTASAVEDEVKKTRNKRDGLKAEIEGLKKELLAQTEQLSICNTGAKRFEKEVTAMITQLQNVKDKYESAKNSKIAKENEISGKSAEIKTLKTTQSKCEKEYENLGIKIKEIVVRLSSWEKSTVDAKKEMKKLVENNGWIQESKEFFGRKNSDFDFEARDVEESKTRLKELKAEQDKLVKKINKKVMNMLESAESEYNELAKKKQIIINDKLKIEAVIIELDIKKETALRNTWVKVNRDFGSIFATLLPGTFAKLELLESGNVMDGLEVKVSFNGVWKDSLTELSGGQRSLLALSLILSLLLFKPAPMYILDEVDAALDLSHTQNIGMMLRTHFSASQFIVVSLKEGMFNNANVIFRTRFVDGVSAVTRTVVGGKNRGNLLQDGENNEEEVLAPQKKKGKTASKRTTANAEN